MDLQALKIFQVVAETGSISKAAQELNYAQSNISAKIQQLEVYFQTSLFHRHNKGVTITEKGQILLDYAKKVFLLIDETNHAIREDDTNGGSLCLGSIRPTATHRLPLILSKYHNAYPNVNITIKTSATSKLISDVLEYNLDGAFVAGSYDHPDLVEKQVFMEELGFVSDTMYPQLSLQDLKTRSLLMFSSPGSTYRKIFMEWLKDKDLPQSRIIEFDTWEAMLSALCSGLGVSLLPFSAVEGYVKTGWLRFHPIQGQYSRVPTIFIYRKDNYVTKALLNFNDMLESLKNPQV